MSEFRIVPTADEHVDGLHRCVDVVARERRFIGLVETPPLAASRAFVREVLANGGVHLVALDAGGEVVGWCDIVRHAREGSRHAGRLGIGVLPRARGMGLGARLLAEALDAARTRGLERVELEVFASNARAIALYERVGFEHEGVKRGARKLDGRYDDDVLMAIWLVAPPK